MPTILHLLSTSWIPILAADAPALVGRQNLEILEVDEIGLSRNLKHADGGAVNFDDLSVGRVETFQKTPALP